MEFQKKEEEEKEEESEELKADNGDARVDMNAPESSSKFSEEGEEYRATFETSNRPVSTEGKRTLDGGGGGSDRDCVIEVVEQKRWPSSWK